MPSKQKRLIIFAPGWGGQPIKNLNPLLFRFREGFDVVSLRYPNHGFGGLWANSRAVSEQIEALRRSYDHITWIGHSMGGLLPFSGYGLSKLIDAFVALGSPFHGSPWAKLAWWSDSARDMRQDSWYVENLKDRLIAHQQKTSPDKDPMPMLIVNAKFDAIVPKGLELNYKNIKTIEVPTTHVGLILSKRVYQEIWAWLTYDIFGEVGHEDGEGFISDLRAK